jgi:predicted HTH domain antitoxin
MEIHPRRRGRIWKLTYALRLYREDRITKERAAEIAGVSLYEIIAAARQQGIPASLTLSEALEEIERLVPHGDKTTAPTIVG